MSASTTTSSAWSRLRAPLAALTVAGFLGAAVVAPFAMPSSPANAETIEVTPEMKARLEQTFIPNESPEQDLVFADVKISLSEDEQRRAEQEAAAKKQAEEEEDEAAEGDETPSSSDSDSSDSATPKYTGGGSPAQWMKKAGIAESDWGYVDYIISHESGWNPNATNASSGACGLAQALPCSKVPGNGYDPIDNLKWASGYATDRYGSWKGAYSAWQSQNWW